VYGRGSSCGVYGYHSNGHYGYLGSSSYGAYGYYNSGNYGMLGYNGVAGVYGNGSYYGVRGESSMYGVYGSSGHYAGYFSGDARVTGRLEKGAGSFLIDHPLDPENKTLRHNFVESPENLCLYRGTIVLGKNGEAVVTMPDYFKALTKENEATVTLTSIGKPFDVGYEWNDDFTQFVVYGDADRKLSYIVLADRDDPVMKQLYKPVEEEKGDGNFEKGLLLYPEAFGYPEEKGYDYQINERTKPKTKDTVPDKDKIIE